MSMHKVTATQITGLSLTTWNTVDCDSFVTVATGATAALVLVLNTVNGGRPLGARTTGKTTTILDPANNIGALSAGHVIIPLGTGNQIDLYPGNTGLEFYILGFFSSAWTFFDIDSTAVNLPAGTGSIGTVTAPNDVPVSSTIMLLESMGNSQWRPKGETTTSAISGRFMLMKLDASRQVDVATSTTKRIFGFCTTGFTWRTWYPAQESGVEDGTFYDSSTTNAGKPFAAVISPDNANTEGFCVRENGTTTPSTVPAGIALEGTVSQESFYAPLDTGGVFEWAAENGTTGLPRVIGYFDSADAASGLTITSVTPSSFDSGIAGIVIAGAGFGASQGSSTVDIGGQAQTVTAWSDTSITFTSVRGSVSPGNATLTLTKG